MAYTYDANGNLVSGNGRTLTYTSYNAPATIANAAYGYAYTYNAEHERVRLVATREDAKAAIFSYIEPFYNRQRIHQSLGYLSPQKFEKQNVCLD